MGAKPRETPLRTLGFATIVAFACALVVSIVVHYLRPVQLALASIDETRAVVEAAGWHGDVAEMTDLEIARAFRAFELRLADLQTGELAVRADPADFDYQAVLSANPGQRPRHMPVYLLREDGRLVRAVLAFYGPGMWSTIHGLLALEGDLVTVNSLVIYEHRETPGIGDRIEAPTWLNSWQGKRLFDVDGNYRLHVDSHPGPEDAAFAVDAITGATVTVNAVEEAVSRWMGAQGYGPILVTLREEAP